MSERSVIIDEIRSPLLEFGASDSDEAVIFVHGNPGSIRDWDTLARSAGELGRAVAIDMPGFGAADKPADFDYSVGGYAHRFSSMTRLLVRSAFQACFPSRTGRSLMLALVRCDFASLLLDHCVPRLSAEGR